MPHPFSNLELFHVDADAVAEQHDQDGQADGGLGGRDGEDKEHENLAGQIAQEISKGHKIEVNRQQHQLHAHEQQNHAAPVDEDAAHRNGEEHGTQGQQVGQGDHSSFSTGIFTSRTRSLGRTATCSATFCTRRPRRRRKVSVIAPTIASSRM